MGSKHSQVKQKGEIVVNSVNGAHGVYAELDFLLTIWKVKMDDG